MADHLKERVLEIVSIVKECPENLQPLCFELLLRDYLEGRQRPPVAPSSPASPPPPSEQPQAQDSIAAGETSTGQQDLKAGDLHVKVRKFMSEDLPRRIVKLEVDLDMPLAGDHPERKVFEGAARGCPVHHSLHPDIEVVMKWSWRE